MQEKLPNKNIITAILIAISFKILSGLFLYVIGFTIFFFYIAIEQRRDPAPRSRSREKLNFTSKKNAAVANCQLTPGRSNTPQKFYRVVELRQSVCSHRCRDATQSKSVVIPINLLKLAFGG